MRLPTLTPNGGRTSVANFTELAHKKVAGIPVLYLAAGAVIILSIVAWKMKPAPSAVDTTPADAAGDASADEAANGLSDPYANLGTQGTVTVVQQPTDTTPDPVVKTNDDWVRDGATWLGSTAGGNVPGTDAYTALQKYVTGQDRTYAENGWVNAWIKQGGLPPEGISEGGTVQSKPAQKQFPNPPGTHNVTGNSDNTLALVANLYYGNSSGDTVNLLEEANPSLASSTTLPTGAAVKVPAYTAPVFWTVTARMTWAQAAAKNGTSEQVLKNLNNGTAGWRNAAYLDKGRSIRVK